MPAKSTTKAKTAWTISTTHNNSTSQIPSFCDRKISGTKLIHTEDNTAYAQLCFVPQETLILVRRAPARRQRSVRRIVHSHMNDLMPEEEDVLSVGPAVTQLALFDIRSCLEVATEVGRRMAIDV